MRLVNRIYLLIPLVALLGYVGACGPVDMEQTADVSNNNALEGNAPPVDPTDVPPPPPEEVRPEASVQAIQLPTRVVRMPSLVERNEPIVYNTSEDQNFERNVDHYKIIHRPQLEVTKHQINRNLLLKHRYFTKVINHPIKRTEVYGTRSVNETHEVMPTEEETTTVTVGRVAPCPYYGRRPYFYRGGWGWPYGYRGMYY